MSNPLKFNARLLIVGDVMLDRYWQGPTLRTSLEAPVPIVNIHGIDDRPGGAANVAFNIATLSGQSRLLGVTGNDEAADTLERLLQQRGVACRLHRMPHWQTIIKLRVLSQQQQLIRLDFEKPYQQGMSDNFLADYERALADVDAVIISDYGKGTVTDVQALIRLARYANKPIYIDPNGNDYQRYQGATLLTLNMRELQAVVGGPLDSTNLTVKGQQLINRLGLEALLVTRGKDGMALIRPAGEMVAIPSCSQDVYDVTGASDTVIAAMSLALASGYSWIEAMNIANVAAGIVVAKSGTATVSLSELAAATERTGDVASISTLTRTELKRQIQQAQARGEKIIFTNGCFDLLHAGHVAFLQAARLLGDRLIVAINDDDSVRRLKGPLRPIYDEQIRLQLLGALDAVDWVIAFNEDTPEPLLHELQPDMLVKGGDYGIDQVVGAHIVRDYGGEVRVIDHDFAECSTSKIIEKIKEIYG